MHGTMPVSNIHLVAVHGGTYLNQLFVTFSGVGKVLNVEVTVAEKGQCSDETVLQR